MTTDHAALIRTIGETTDPETGWPIIKALTDWDRATYIGPTTTSGIVDRMIAAAAERVAAEHARELAEARAERDDLARSLSEIALNPDDVTAADMRCIAMEALFWSEIPDLPATDKAEP